ncbi:hypothetical protein ACU4GD_42120 [Cupriavidus basilensis]
MPEAHGLAFDAADAPRRTTWRCARMTRSRLWAHALLARMAEPAFARRIEALPGYTMAEADGILTPQQAAPLVRPRRQGGQLDARCPARAGFRPLARPRIKLHALGGYMPAALTLQGVPC